MLRANFPHRKARRREEATKRLWARAARNNHQQLMKLEDGGFRAEKETRRLSGLPKED